MLLAVLQTWVGGQQTDDAAEPGGGWGWTDGSPLGWDNWADGQPDNNEWEDDSASCLFMQESGLWYDGICSKKNEFLCEKPPILTGAESLTGGPPRRTAPRCTAPRRTALTTLYRVSDWVDRVRFVLLPLPRPPLQLGGGGASVPPGRGQTGFCVRL